jgi:inner membrane transporter RhtA
MKNLAWQNGDVMPAGYPDTIAMVRDRAFVERLPPHAFFLVSALFHYLGPAFAVLLFQHIEPLGVAWLRIATAAAIFGVWRKPWRRLRLLKRSDLVVIGWLGATLAAMNSVFYEAIARLPLGTVGAIEFLGPIGLAAAGVRTRRNFAALSLAVAGVFVLTEVRVAGEPLGYVFAFLNCIAFVLYVVLGHRIARESGVGGMDRLGAAMLVAMIVALPFGIRDASPAFASPLLLGAAVGVGVSSSVIPYVCDQLAMARLPRATFALMLSLLPATASAVGMFVLHQVPSTAEVCGIALVVVGVGLHRPARS